MRPEIDFAGRAIQGQRDDQEDYYSFEVIDDERLLLVLADGAGGQASGEQASRQAATGFLDAFGDLDGAPLPSLQDALTSANRRLAEFIDRDPAARATMATTLLAVLIEGHALSWISVGDSPLLLFHQGELTRLNADHSGAGTEGEKKLPKNVLRSALVGGRIPLIDWHRDPYALEPGDLILSASDGLWTLTPKEIATHLAAYATAPANEIATSLLTNLELHQKPRQDNATVAVVKVGESGPPSS